MSKPVIHVSKFGTYHPAPEYCPSYMPPHSHNGVACNGKVPGVYQSTNDVAWTVNDTRGYIDEGPDCDECGAENLSFAYVCLDGGEALCEECFDKEEPAVIVPCDCK